jgi:DNA-binding MarR family transcriptional regulator
METRPTGDEPRAVAYEMLRALRSILHRVKRHSHYLGREAGMTLPQILCLVAISELPAGSATAAAVSRRVQLSAPTVTGILDRLERARLVRRERSTTDRRKLYLTLTGEGSERLRSLPTPLQQRFVERVMALAPDERQVLQESLQRIVELMEADDFEPAPILAADEKLQ